MMNFRSCAPRGSGCDVIPAMPVYIWWYPSRLPLSLSLSLEVLLLFCLYCSNISMTEILDSYPIKKKNCAIDWCTIFHLCDFPTRHWTCFLTQTLYYHRSDDLSVNSNNVIDRHVSMKLLMNKAVIHLRNPSDPCKKPYIHVHILVATSSTARLNLSWLEISLSLSLSFLVFWWLFFLPRPISFLIVLFIDCIQPLTYISIHTRTFERQFIAMQPERSSPAPLKSSIKLRVKKKPWR